MLEGWGPHQYALTFAPIVMTAPLVVQQVRAGMPRMWWRDGVYLVGLILLTCCAVGFALTAIAHSALPPHAWIGDDPDWLFDAIRAGFACALLACLLSLFGRGWTRLVATCVAALCALIWLGGFGVP